MSLLQDIKESFESKSYLDEESMESQNFVATAEDDYTNRADVERSEDVDRKAEEEYAKEQEAVRSAIELLEDNLDGIAGLSPAYTESAKEVVNAQLADVSQALSLESGFGQLELDDTGHISMESYLEVRKALAKARKVYSTLSFEGWQQDKPQRKQLIETIEAKLKNADVKTVPVNGQALRKLQGDLVNPSTIGSDFSDLVTVTKDLYKVITDAPDRIVAALKGISKSISEENWAGAKPGFLKDDIKKMENIVNKAGEFNGMKLELSKKELGIEKLPTVILTDTSKRNGDITDFPALSVDEVNKIVAHIKKEFSDDEIQHFRSSAYSFLTKVGVNKPNYPEMYCAGTLPKLAWLEEMTTYTFYEPTFDAWVDLNRIADELLMYCDLTLS